MTRRGFLKALPALVGAASLVAQGEPIVHSGYARLVFKGRRFTFDPAVPSNMVYVIPTRLVPIDELERRYPR